MQQQSLRILLIEDDSSFQDALVQLLGVHNTVHGVFTLREARVELESQEWDLVLLDKELPDGNGADFIAEIKENHPSCAVIIITADRLQDFRTVDFCLKKGADDYVLKSGYMLSDLLVRIPMVLGRTTSDRRLAGIQRQLQEAYKYELVGSAPQIQSLRENILSLKTSSAHVLITGEMGTGKEQVAHRINLIENSKSRAFVTVNCAAIPPHLIESELFGSEKGSYTGSIRNTPGMFELAHEGDIFLDEIGELPLDMQAKLLRVIQHGEVQRVGGRTLTVKVRVIAATNRNLSEEVRRGRFRADLLERIKVIWLKTTPLREMKSDIPALAKVFVPLVGKPRMTISNEAIERLLQHDWPGNVRELRNVIERASIYATRRKSNEIDVEDIAIDLSDERSMDARSLSAAVPSNPDELSRLPFEEFMLVAERTYLAAALRIMNYSAADAAHACRMPRSTMFRRLSHHGLVGRAVPGLRTERNRMAKYENEGVIHGAS